MKDTSTTVLTESTSDDNQSFNNWVFTVHDPSILLEKEQIDALDIIKANISTEGVKRNIGTPNMMLND